MRNTIIGSMCALLLSAVAWADPDGSLKLLRNMSGAAQGLVPAPVAHPAIVSAEATQPSTALRNAIIKGRILVMLKLAPFESENNDGRKKNLEAFLRKMGIGPIIHPPLYLDFNADKSLNTVIVVVQVPKGQEFEFSAKLNKENPEVVMAAAPDLPLYEIQPVKRIPVELIK